MSRDYDYALERKLRELDPELHSRFTDAVFAMLHILSNYKLIFPDFTDHTELHSLNVIDFCNKLIASQIDKLNADEIYCILLGCYFHDTGMGISKVDYDEFSKKIDFKDYFETHSKDDLPAIIRSFHNEYSGLFIEKYSKFLELPSKEHLFAIKQIARGHRKTNLLDKGEYPSDFKVPNQNNICLPYLAALVRLADEIDITAARHVHINFDLSNVTNEIDLIEFMKHEAVKELLVTDKEFIMKIKSDDNKVIQGLEVVAKKMQKTLDECRKAVNGVTPFEITQERVRIVRI